MTLHNKHLDSPIKSENDKRDCHGTLSPAMTDIKNLLTENIWLNQNQLATLFVTSKSNISMHTSNILKEKELHKNSVVKDFLTTASDDKEYNVGVGYIRPETKD